MFDCRRMNSTKLLLAELPIQVKRRRSYFVSAALMSGASTKPDRPGMPSVRPSGLATPKEVIAEDHAAGARQVARHDRGFARNVLAEKLPDQAHLAVDAAARRLASKQRDALAAIEFLRTR
jgi:hypothetical protein